jgi:hypothetical protein
MQKRRDSPAEQFVRIEQVLRHIPVPAENDEALERLIARLNDAEKRARGVGR